MLHIINVSKYFISPNKASIVALKKLDVHFRRGEFVVMLGENGAGKTTLFSVIMGLQYVDTGNVYINDTDITYLPDYLRSKYITLIHQGRGSGLPGSLTVYELLSLTFKFNFSKKPKKKFSRKEIFDRLDAIEPGFSRVIDMQVWSLSGGEYQLLNLVNVMIICEVSDVRERILLLDEHVSQLAPNARDRVLAMTKKIVDEYGLLAILSTHSEYVATSIGSRQIIMKNGSIVADYAGDMYVCSPDKLRGIIN